MIDLRRDLVYTLDSHSRRTAKVKFVTETTAGFVIAPISSCAAKTKGVLCGAVCGAVRVRHPNRLREIVARVASRPNSNDVLDGRVKYGTMRASRQSDHDLCIDSVASI